MVTRASTFFNDEATGLKAIVADPLHRARPRRRRLPHVAVRERGEALRGRAELSRGMTYKNAMADLELGGGKSVIIGDRAHAEDAGAVRGVRPRRREPRRPLLTAEDVGIADADIS